VKDLTLVERKPVVVEEVKLEAAPVAPAPVAPAKPVKK
jgi:hypothetical protein